MSKKSSHGGSSAAAQSGANQKISLRHLKGRKWKLFSEQTAGILEDTSDKLQSDISSVAPTLRQSTPSVMQLNLADRNLYGLHPETDPFVAVICNHCSAVVKPQGLSNHIDRRHHGQTSDTTKSYKNIHRRLSATPPKQPKCEKRRRYSMTKINEHEIIEHNTTTAAPAQTVTAIAIPDPVDVAEVPPPVPLPIVEPSPIVDNWTATNAQPMAIDIPSIQSPNTECKVPNEFVCHVRIESSYYPDLPAGTSTFVDTEKLLPEIEIFTQDLEDFSAVAPLDLGTVEYVEQPHVAVEAIDKPIADEHVVDIETVDMINDNDEEELASETFVLQQQQQEHQHPLTRPKNINARMLAEWDCFGKGARGTMSSNDDDDDWDSGCDSDLEEDANDMASIFETNAFSDIFGDSRISATSDCFIKSTISGSGSSASGGDGEHISGNGDKENTSDSPRKWNSKTMMSSRPLQSNCFGMRKIGGGCMLSRNVLSMGQLTNTSTSDCFMFNGGGGSAGIKRRIEKRGVRTDIASIIDKVKAHIAQKQRTSN